MTGIIKTDQLQGAQSSTIAVPSGNILTVGGTLGVTGETTLASHLNLGDGDVDFKAVRKLLLENGFDGWCTVEQDCDPEGKTSPFEDAKINRKYLESVGFKNI